MYNEDVLKWLCNRDDCYKMPEIIIESTPMSTAMIATSSVTIPSRFDKDISRFMNMNIGRPYVKVSDCARYTPSRILRSGNRTIVFWLDGTKTIIKLSEGDADSEYAAFTAALAIKIFGNNSKVRKIVGKTQHGEKRKTKEKG